MGFLSKTNGSKSNTQSNNALGAAGELPIQAKMRFGQPDDAYEQEADRVADSVVNNSRSSSKPGNPAAMAPSISNYVQKQEAADNKEDKDAAAADKDAQEEEGAKGEMSNKEEDKDVQKKEDKKEEEKPVQKKSTDNKEEEKKVQKKEDKKEEEKPVQKKEDKKEEEKPVQKKENKKEEEKPVQKKEDKKEEEDPVQKKENKKEEENPVQKKETKKEEEKPVQKKNANNPKAEEPAIEKQIIASKEGGKSMEDDVRKEMEKQFSKDFKHVRIHNDPMSYELCRKINALAFTHGTHIYFAEGKYNPQSVEGKRLLAHELTHVVQQGGMLMRKMVQKTGDDKKSGGANASEKKDEFTEPGLGRLKKGSDGKLAEVELDHLNVPGLKQAFGPGPGDIIDKREGERPTDQVTVWESSITLTGAASSKLDGKLNDALKTYKKLPSLLNGKQIFFLKKKTADKGGMIKGIIMGSKNDVLQKMKRPQWDKNGKGMSFDVDHQKEIQLGGQHAIGNMWLLASFQNQDSGRNIKDNMVAQLNDLVKKAKPSMGDLPSGTTIKKQYAVKLTNGAKAEPNMKPNKDAIKYDKKEVEDGAQIDGLTYLSEEEIIKDNLIGNESNLAIYTSPGGGGKVDVPYNKDKQGKKLGVNKKFGNLNINSVVYNGPGANSTVNITLFEGFKKDLKQDVKFDAELSPSDAVAYGGVLSKASVLAQLKANPPNLKYMSPFTLDFIELDESGLDGKGKLKTGLSLLDNLEIDIAINESGIWLSKTFAINEIKMPPPFKIDVCSFTIMLGTGGIAASGDIEFSIANIGKGALHGEKRGNGFALEGSFKLDEKICDGEVTANYQNIEGVEKWKIEGTVKFKKGAITGVKSGSIKVGYDGKILTAKGDAELEAKWIEKGSLEAEVGEDKFRFTGKFTLGKMPGIESGDGEVTVEKTEGEEYQLSAKGKAKSSIKVVDAELSIEYKKGILTINGSVAYSKGIMSGKIFVTVTNGPPPAEAPNPGGADGEFRVFGGGELTAQITSWLKGTIGVKFDENNQVIFSGKLAITSAIEVFPKKGVDKELLNVGIDIPIFGIPVGPKTIGLKARIEGAINAFANIGPGTIEGVELGITFNPDKPEDTHVTGTGKFVIPADAGIKLAVRASIGLSALIGGVEGGIELEGGLKLSAKAQAAINVDWTPSSGLELNAELSADVTPKLSFDINGYIKAWFAWYDKVWKWNLAHYEYGSDLALGVTLPIKYKEGQAFNVNFEDIQFRKPDIDPMSVVKGVISDIKNKRN
jgi:chemotaxis protein histidine kinase CheA